MKELLFIAQKAIALQHETSPLPHLTQNGSLASFSLHLSSSLYQCKLLVILMFSILFSVWKTRNRPQIVSIYPHYVFVHFN